MSVPYCTDGQTSPLILTASSSRGKKKKASVQCDPSALWKTYDHTLVLENVARICDVLESLALPGDWSAVTSQTSNQLTHQVGSQKYLWRWASSCVWGLWIICIMNLSEPSSYQARNPSRMLLNSSGLAPLLIVVISNHHLQHICMGFGTHLNNM